MVRRLVRWARLPAKYLGEDRDVREGNFSCIRHRRARRRLSRNLLRGRVRLLWVALPCSCGRSIGGGNHGRVGCRSCTLAFLLAVVNGYCLRLVDSCFLRCFLL